MCFSKFFGSTGMSGNKPKICAESRLVRYKRIDRNTASQSHIPIETNGVSACCRFINLKAQTSTAPDAGPLTPHAPQKIAMLTATSRRLHHLSAAPKHPRAQRSTLPRCRGPAMTAHLSTAMLTSEAFGLLQASRPGK